PKRDQREAEAVPDVADRVTNSRTGMSTRLLRVLDWSRLPVMSRVVPSASGSLIHEPSGASGLVPVYTKPRSVPQADTPRASRMMAAKRRIDPSLRCEVRGVTEIDHRDHGPVHARLVDQRLARHGITVVVHAHL